MSSRRGIASDSSCSVRAVAWLNVPWGSPARVPCSIKLLKAPKTTAAFYDFEAYERVVEAARSDDLAYLIVLLGGEAGLRWAR